MEPSTSKKYFYTLRIMSVFTTFFFCTKLVAEEKVIEANKTYEGPVEITSSFSENDEEYTQTHEPIYWLDSKTRQALVGKRDRRINLHFLGRQSNNGLIQWNSPDGATYFIDPTTAQSGAWTFNKDSTGNKRIGFYHDGVQDAILNLSLIGSFGTASTLLHHEDDFAETPYYFATDGGNNRMNQMGNWAFILRAKGREKSPLVATSGFFVMTVCHSETWNSSKNRWEFSCKTVK